MSPRKTPGPWARATVAVLFLVCIGVSLAVPLYNRRAPSLWGVPFFYWFQFVWIIVTGCATAVAYRLRV